VQSGRNKKHIAVWFGTCVLITSGLAVALRLLSVPNFGIVHATALSQPASAPADALIPRGSRKIAPPLEVRDIDGKRIDLAHYRGEVVLLDFWAVHCGGCKLEIPWYVEFDRKYHRDGLQLIGIDMYGESPSLIRPFMAAAQMTYPVAVGTDAIGQRFHVEEMPLTLLIDRRGRMAYSHAGVVDKDSFERNIESLLH